MIETDKGIVEDKYNATRICRAQALCFLHTQGPFGPLKLMQKYDSSRTLFVMESSSQQCISAHTDFQTRFRIFSFISVLFLHTFVFSPFNSILILNV